MARSRPSMEWMAIGACMALAAALRFPGLMTQSLWIDEIYSADMIQWPLHTILHVQDGHPPLFALVHRLVAAWLDADLAGRVISATAGVLSVGLLVRFATRIWDVRTGLVAGVLLALSPLHVWYSQEGRSYALVVLLAIAASLALVEAMRGAGWRAWVSFGCLTLGGLLTHYLYAAFVLAQAAFLALRGGQVRLLVAGAVAAAIGAACLPVLGPEATSFVNVQRGFEWLALPYAGFTFVAGFGLGPPVEALHRERGLAVVAGVWPEVAAVAVVVLGCALALPRALRRSGPFGTYVLLWVTVPVAVVFAGSWLRDGAFNVRYAITALPAIVLCFTLVITQGSARRLGVGLALLVTLSLASIWQDRRDDARFREDLRSAGRFLTAEVVAGDRIVVIARYMDFGVRHYYRGAVPVDALPVRPIRTPEDAVQNLRALASGSHVTWLVLAREWEDDPAGHLQAALVGFGAAVPAARFPGVRILRVQPQTP